jgi:hypothetical protein
MTYKLNRATTYIFIAFLIGVFVFAVTNYGIELSNNDNANLSNSSEEYINKITGGNRRLGFNTSIYDDDAGKALEGDQTDNKNEFALDFFFGKRNGNVVQRFVYVVLNVPTLIMVDIFQLTGQVWQDIAGVLDWLLNIFIFIAVVNYVRGKD